MKIEQNEAFQPITITLETVEEVKVIWYALTTAEYKDFKESGIRNEISSWLANMANLCGEE